MFVKVVCRKEAGTLVSKTIESGGEKWHYGWIHHCL
jgi:hypothetical protein